jgi:hypothetical protein
MSAWGAAFAARHAGGPVRPVRRPSVRNATRIAMTEVRRDRRRESSRRGTAPIISIVLRSCPGWTRYKTGRKCSRPGSLVRYKMTRHDAAVLLERLLDVH